MWRGCCFPKRYFGYPLRSCERTTVLTCWHLLIVSFSIDFYSASLVLFFSPLSCSPCSTLSSRPALFSLLLCFSRVLRSTLLLSLFLCFSTASPLLLLCVSSPPTLRLEICPVHVRVRVCGCCVCKGSCCARTTRMLVSIAAGSLDIDLSSCRANTLVNRTGLWVSLNPIVLTR